MNPWVAVLVLAVVAAGILLYIKLWGAAPPPRD